jgi:hypothetical protein
MSFFGQLHSNKATNTHIASIGKKIHSRINGDKNQHDSDDNHVHINNMYAKNEFARENVRRKYCHEGATNESTYYDELKRVEELTRKAEKERQYKDKLQKEATERAFHEAKINQELKLKAEQERIRQAKQKEEQSRILREKMRKEEQERIINEQKIRAEQERSTKERIAKENIQKAKSDISPDYLLLSKEKISFEEKLVLFRFQKGQDKNILRKARNQLLKKYHPDIYVDKKIAHLFTVKINNYFESLF